VSYVTALRLRTPRGEESKISIGREVADPSQVVVYLTDFDKDGFLKFHSLNGVTSRHGEPSWYHVTARSSYMALWKEEFAGLPCLDVPRKAVGEHEIEEVHWCFKGGAEIKNLAILGQRTIEELKRLILDLSSPTYLLTETGSKLQAIDKELETLSLAYPLLGAIVRVFIMEKENLRGDDALCLAESTGELYRTLQARCERFNQLFVSFLHQQGVFEGGVLEK
jgi:hypothetical protein